MGHVWEEPESGEERLADVWEVDLPAASPVRIELNSEMHGDLRCGGASEYVPPLKGWQGRLPRGRCRLEVRCVRRNNRLEYGVMVTPDYLLPGSSRSLKVPGELTLAVGQDALMEISSFGPSDVRAELLNGEGRLLARSDDRPDDWNFQLRERLAAGQYTLRVTSVGVSEASTVVSLTQVPERLERAIRPPFEPMDVDLVGTLLYPLELPETSQLLMLGAVSAENLELSVEVRDGGEWRVAAREAGARPHLLLPVSGGSGSEARVRLGSLDGRGLPAALEAEYQSPRLLREGKAKAGLPSGAIQLDLERAGSFRVTEGEKGLRVATSLFSPCVPPLDGIVTGERTMWLSHAAGASVHRLRLDEEALRVPLAAGAPSFVDLEPAEGLVLVRASSRSGWAGLALANGSLDASAVVGKTSLVLADARPHTSLQVKVWPSPTGRGQQVVLLERRVFTAPESQAMDWGELEGPLAPGSARVVSLPAGEKRMRVALDRDLLAAVRGPDGELAVIWRGGAPFEELLEGETQEIVLLNPGETESFYRVDVVPLPQGAGSLNVTPSNAAEVHLDRASWIRIPVQGGTVHWDGAVRDALWRGADGTVVNGPRPGLGLGKGTLHVRCDPGWTVVWQEVVPGAGPPWGTMQIPDARDVQIPALLRLSGPAQTFRVDPGTPGLLLARSAEALVLEVPGVGVRYFGDTTFWDLATEGGPLEIRVRALGSGPLRGELELKYVCASPLSEGLGPETLLTPGESRVFRFELSRPGLVGVGVRADSVAVTTSLRNARGEVIGRGFLQMHELPSGAYYLALSIPPDSEPVRARAAVAGLERPSSGPPDEIVARYLELERERSGSAGGGDER